MIRDAPWLTRLDRDNLHIYCCAVAKYRKDPKAASNALISRMGSMRSKLRLNDRPTDGRKAYHQLSPAAQVAQTDEPPCRYDFFGDETPEEKRKRKEYWGLGEDDE
jgi:hypothetical protein